MEGKRKGVLVICHGSKDMEWVHMIHSAVQKARIPIPTVVCFLEANTDRHMLSIPDGVMALQQQGVSDVLAIPLFLSSFTTHLDEIRDLLGVTDSKPYQRTVCSLDPTCSIQICDPLNDHPVVARILVKRIQELAYFSQLNHGTVVMIAHGVNEDSLYLKYEDILKSISKQLKEKIQNMQFEPGLAIDKEDSILYSTFYPHTIRDVVQNVAEYSCPLVIPLFLSEGYFTKHKIPNALQGLSYVYLGKALLPDEDIVDWLEEKAKPFYTN